MNKSYMDDEDTRQELEEAKRLSIEEILDKPKVDPNCPTLDISIIDILEE